MNEINGGVINGGVSGGSYYVNIQTVSEANIHKSVDSTNKSYENTHKRSEMEYTG